MDRAPSIEMQCNWNLQEFHIVDLQENNFKFIKVGGQIMMNISFMNQELSLAADEFCIKEYYSANDGRVIFCHDRVG